MTVSWSYGHCMAMASKKEHRALERELLDMVAPAFPGIAVEVAHAKRWDRMSVTFTWPGFAGLLPEERFHRLTCAIPETFVSERMAGFVWLELTAEESVDDLLSMPRSEDRADAEAGIYSKLKATGFAAALADALSPAPESFCGGDFSSMCNVLRELKFSAKDIEDVKLICIRNHAFCDCQVIMAALPELAKRHDRVGRSLAG